MSNDLSTWDDVRRLADELEVQIHLAGMDARDAWRELEPRLERLEKQITRSGKRAEETISHELHEVHEALRAIRENVHARARDLARS